MIIHLDYSSMFATLLDVTTDQVILDCHQATVEDVMKELINNQPDYPARLERENLLLDGKWAAMLVCGSRILAYDDLVNDGDTIRVMSPICGG